MFVIAWIYRGNWVCTKQETVYVHDIHFLLCVQHENVTCSLAKEIHLIMYSYIPSTHCSQGHSIVQTSDFILVENTQNCFIY